MFKIKKAELTMNEADALDKILMKKPGQVMSITYKVTDPRIKLKDFYKVSRYLAQYAAVNNRKDVKEYHESHIICNDAVQFDEPTDVPHVFNHKKTGLKLRVPLMRNDPDESHYYIADKEVTQEEYYKQMEQKGYVRRKKNKTYAKTEVRTFFLKNILDIE